MSGKVTVANTGDWLTPYAVEVAIDGRPPTVSRFTIPALTQEYALAMAEAHDLDVLYDVEREPGQPRKISAEEFATRITRVCAKCRKAVPLAKYRPLTHNNVGKPKGLVHHGWSERCLPCEAEHG